MSNIYDELLAAGGYDQGRAVNPLNNPYFSTGLPSQNPGIRPDSNTATFSLGAGDGSGFFDFSAFPGAEQFAEGAIDPQALQQWLTSNGYQLRQSDNPDSNTSARFLTDASGQLLGPPQVFENGDSAFRNAALAAALVTGANIFTALPGAAAAASGAAPGAGGATAFPVADAGQIITSALPSSGGVGTLGTIAPSAATTASSALAPIGQAAAFAPTLPTLPTVAGGLGAVGAAGGAVADPIASYLTTGASEMSTVGNALTGAGGASGAVGTATPASFLQQAGSFLGNGGARSIFDIVSGIYGMSLANDAREASDPFAQYRGYFGQQLMDLERNPSLITSRPGYVAGLEAIGRNNAARGYAGSGNETAVLSRYAGDFYGQEMQRLAGLAGAGQTPGAGQFQAAQLTGQGLASIGYGLAPFLGGPR